MTKSHRAMGIPGSFLPHLLHGLHPTIQLQGEEAAATAALLLPNKATPLPLSSCSPVVQVSGLNCIPVGPQGVEQQPTASYICLPLCYLKSEQRETARSTLIDH